LSPGRGYQDEMFRSNAPDGSGGYRVRPSKPLVLLSLPIAVAIIVFGLISQLHARHPNYAFLALWIAIGVCMIGFNLWSAFGKRGALYRVDRDR